MTIPIRSVSLRCLWFVPLSVPSVFFRLFPSTSLFRLVSFQFSLLGSDCSESRSLLSIRLHSCSATIPFSVDLRVYCPLILWPLFPLQIMIRFLLFCSVYKSGKLCSYSLACNRTKPPVSWPQSTLNPQSLSVSVPASQPHSRSLHYFRKPRSVCKSKDPTFCEARAQHISWGQVFHPYDICSASLPFSSLRSALPPLFRVPFPPAYSVAPIRPSSMH